MIAVTSPARVGKLTKSAPVFDTSTRYGHTYLSLLDYFSVRIGISHIDWFPVLFVATWWHISSVSEDHHTRFLFDSRHKITTNTAFRFTNDAGKIGIICFRISESRHSHLSRQNAHWLLTVRTQGYDLDATAEVNHSVLTSRCHAIKKLATFSL